MLFNSFEFMLGFLPVLFAGYLLFSRWRRYLAACSWLAAGSLFFYGYWAPTYLLLLLLSIGSNYAFGLAIQRSLGRGTGLGRLLVTTAIGLNLAALAYFKYANFLVDNLAALTGHAFDIGRVVLPLGISFFTFTQIAYLVDTYQGKVKEANFVHYLLFVTYFPHLIAGPILHHAEMMPQFRKTANYGFNTANFVSGLMVFLIGLAKKIVLADGIQPYVGPVFDAPLGQPLTIGEAWVGALAYSLQLYFDFSGYSDMAIGLSRMFNIELPLNFNSPYKAANITEFWRRWHMTLSRFLRDYLYIPLGGNRHGPARRYLNLMTTMVLGGLWHGAGWPFVLWGALHGFYLVANHAWQYLRARVRLPLSIPAWLARLFGGALTFLCVVVAWVFFRARDFDAAWRVVLAMADFGSLAFPVGGFVTPALQLIFPSVPVLPLPAFTGDRELPWILALLLIVWAFPNTQQVMARLSFLRRAAWSIHAGTAGFAVGVMSFWILLLLMVNETRGLSEFIYFNF